RVSQSRDLARSSHLRRHTAQAFPQMALFFFYGLITSSAQTENLGPRKISGQLPLLMASAHHHRWVPRRREPTMRKRTRRVGVWLAPLAAMAAVWIGAAPAQAAATRAEYIAQVDPICAAAAPAIDQAYGVYSRNYKRWERQATHGTLRAWIKQT